MKKKTKTPNLIKVVLIVAIVFITLLIGFGCFVLYRMLGRAVNDQILYLDPLSVNHYNAIKTYDFDPEAILDALKQDKKYVFQQLPDDERFNDDRYKPVSFLWQQQDFLIVAKNLYQHTRTDTLNEWRLYGLWFSRNDCSNKIGFDYADISYFNPNTQEHTAIEINLLNRTTSLGLNQHFDSDTLFGGWESLAPTRIKTTADDALKIAELHGGKEFSQKSQDPNCTISVSLIADKNVWEVIYYPNFQVNVDPYSDHYEIIVK